MYAHLFQTNYWVLNLTLNNVYLSKIIIWKSEIFQTVQMHFYVILYVLKIKYA